MSTVSSGPRASTWAPTVAVVVGKPAEARDQATALLRGAGFQVWTAGSAAELAAPSHHPQANVVVVLTQGTDPARQRAVRSAAAACPGGPVLAVMPAGGRHSSYRRAIISGARGVVLDGELERTLVAAAHALVAGQMVVPAVLGDQLAPRPLSHREKQVLSLVVLGLTNREIADRMYLAESTVKTHLSAAFRKIDAHSRSEAVARIQDPDAGFGVGILALADDLAG